MDKHGHKAPKRSTSTEFNWFHETIRMKCRFFFTAISWKKFVTLTKDGVTNVKDVEQKIDDCDNHLVTSTFNDKSKESTVKMTF